MYIHFVFHRIERNSPGQVWYICASCEFRQQWEQAPGLDQRYSCLISRAEGGVHRCVEGSIRAIPETLH